MSTQKEKEDLRTYLMGIVHNLPESPGCYQYLDDTGTIIYVGKAKNLKRRVSSYFNKTQDNLKTRILVSKIRDIKYVVLNSETDALLLENNLIKKHNPRYNILLKDGKTYPSIVVTNEYLPKIHMTRKIVKGYGTYFGPYSHIPTLYGLLELINNLYPLRRCNDRISKESVEAGKHKECLEYHIKNCKAPCIAKQSHEDYIQNIEEAKQILKGNTSELQRKLLEQIKAHAERMEFEEAEILKKKYLMLENYQSKSEVVSRTINNIDVFNIEDSEKVAYINYMHVANGCIVRAYTFEYAKRIEESIEDLLVAGIVEMRNRYGNESKEVILPFPVEQLDLYSNVIVPQKGDKKKLLDLSKLNVMQYKKDRIKQSDKLNPEQKSVRLLKELQDALKLPTLPIQIECFDNSNISGTDAVAACVVFIKGKPSKNDYRKYNIKTVVGPDDYASMKEVVRRRYTRLLEEEKQLPNLIIADGGKGQMEVIREVIVDELHLAIPIAGLAKNDKHRTNELLYGFPQQTIGLKTDSALFHLLTHIQDEVHRFAITFHRDKRSKHQITSELDSIPGIGPKTKEILLKAFKSIKRIKEATLEDISAVIGEKKAEIIKNNLI